MGAGPTGEFDGQYDEGDWDVGGRDEVFGRKNVACWFGKRSKDEV